LLLELTMSRFIEGEARSQSVLFPERLDDWIADDNPVRAVDAFVDELDLAELGFEGAERLLGVGPFGRWYSGRPVRHSCHALAFMPSQGDVAQMENLGTNEHIEGINVGR
jgi:hypothetical protein